MKICLINPADIPRTEIFDLGYHLSLKGHEVSILYPTRKIILDGKVKTIPFPAYFLPKIHYTIPDFFKEYEIISKLVKEDEYEVIQACDYDYLTSLPAVIAGRKLNVPVILTTDAFPGVSWYFGNHFVDLAAKIYTHTLGKFMIDSCDKFVILSKELLKDALRIGIPEKKVYVIPNGVDFKQFNPDVDGNNLRKKLNINNDEKVLLFVGRLSLVKRIDIILDISKKFLKSDLKIKTIIVGEGEYGSYYRQMADSLKNIMFVGSVPHKDLHEYFAIADIFLLPSLSEGLPNVLLEASACGKPIVATNTGGISDIVIHGETGYLVKPDDIDSYFHYVELLLNDENLSRQLGNNGYEHVSKEFSWDVIIEKYENIYKTMVKK